MQYWNMLYILLWFMIALSSVNFLNIDQLALAVGVSGLASCEILYKMFLKKNAKPIGISKNRIATVETMKESQDYSSVHSTPKSTYPPCELDISKLDIGSPRKSVCSSKSTSNGSPGFVRPKPILSPARLGSPNAS